MVSESAAYAAVEAAQNLLALLVVPASLFWLSPADMGVITLALLVSQIVLTISTLGLDFALIRYYFTWSAADQPARAGGVLALCSLASAVILVASAAILTIWLGPSGLVWTMAVAYGTGLAVRATPMALYRVTSQLRPYAAVAIGGSLAQGVLQVGLLAAGTGIGGYLTGAAAGAWLSALVACAALRQRHALSPIRWPDAAMSRLAALNTLSSLFNRLIAGADRLAVFSWSTWDSLGVYGTAARWTTPLRLVGGATKTALAPALSRQEHAGELSGTPGGIVTPFVTLVAFLAASVQLLSWLLSLTPWWQHLQQFQELLSVLVLAQVLGVITVIDQLVLYYVARPAHSAALSAFNALAIVIGLVWLVPSYGATGAAMVQLGANAATLLLLAAWSGGTLRASPDIIMALAILILGTVSVWWLQPWIHVWLTIAAVLTLGVWTWQQLDGRGWLRRFGWAA